MAAENVVASELLPTQVPNIILDERLVARAQEELYYAAFTSQDGCYGYFPGSPWADEEGLPVCAEFASRFPDVQMGMGTFDFSYLIRSLTAQQALYDLHLDFNTTMGTGYESNVEHMPRYWRLVINLGTTVRRMTYSIENPATLEIENRGHLLVPKTHNPKKLKTAYIMPGQGHVFNGMLFCANQVLHRGIEDEEGKFLLSYTYEEAT